MPASTTVSAGDPALDTDYNELRKDVITGQLMLLTGTAGTDTITASADAQYVAYAAGDRFIFEPANDNTGATTININTLGAKSIKKGGTSASLALGAGDLQQSLPCLITYDGTDFILLSNIPEMVEFFANTGITGAEAETLTGGGDANALHLHPNLYKNGVSSQDISSTVTLDIAHSIGATPGLIKLNCSFRTAGSVGTGFALASFDGTLASAVFSSTAATSTLNGTSSSSAALFRLGVDGSNYTEANVSIGATNISIGWSKTGSPTGTVLISWEAWTKT